MRATTVFLALTIVTTSAQGSAERNADVNAGAALFRRADCNVCHSKIMKGDGNAIFTRPARIVNSADALARRVHVCAQQAHVAWTSSDEADVAAYLNVSFYRFR